MEEKASKLNTLVNINESLYEFGDAYAQGVIEYGSVVMIIQDEEIWLSIEESSDKETPFRVFLNDMEKRDLLNVDFNGETDDEITSPDFVEEVKRFYAFTTSKKN